MPAALFAVALILAACGYWSFRVGSSAGDGGLGFGIVGLALYIGAAAAALVGALFL